MKRFFLVLVLLLACIGVASADTLIVYTTNATDAYLYRTEVNGTFTSIHDATSGGASSTATTMSVGIRSAVNFENTMYRIAKIFDTSALPDTATIDSALLGEYVASKYTTLGDDGVAPVSYIYDGAFNADDYNKAKFGTTIYAPYYNISAMTTSAYNNWSLNAAGLAAISKTGNTAIGERIRADIENTNAWVDFQNGTDKRASVVFRTADYVLYPPLIQIEYTPADTTPPQAITNLANGTYDCSDGHVDISWDNPTDTDYYRLNAYLNGTLIYYGNSTDSVTLTGLPENTAMTFNTATEDLAGNINNTHWQNLSFTTGSCAASPVSNISCYFTNITGVSLGWNTSEWNITQGQWTWGTWITNVTQGNISYYSCYDESVTPTITPTWTPEINPPSRDSLTGTIKEWIKKFLKDVFE